MKKSLIKISALLFGATAIASTFSCSTPKQQESPMKAKVEEYAPVELKSDLVSR